jgi:acyl-coenzyme A thioesterase PaaI-like protein
VAKTKLELIDDHFCFACGKDNPDGLNLTWVVEGKTTHALFTPQRKFQGWKGILHGGIVAALLDEAMGRLAWIACGGGVTAELTVRFLKPAPTNEKIFVFGEITGENRKVVEMRARLHRGSPSGEILAHSTGKAIKI